MALLDQTKRVELDGGEWVDVRQLSVVHRLVISRERLTGAVRRIALVAQERSRGFRFALHDGQIELSASNPDLGEARETLPTDYAGERFETGFNARYMLEALGAQTAKEVVLELSSELSPAALRPADAVDEISVIMPMRM